MGEVGVDRLQLRVFGQILEKLLAHPHQGGRAAGRKVQATDQLLPPWFRRSVQALQGICPCVLANRFDGELDAAAIGTEAIRQRLEESQPLGWLGRDVAREQGLRERHSRGFAPAREQQLAQASGERPWRRSPSLPSVRAGIAPAR